MAESVHKNFRTPSLCLVNKTWEKLYVPCNLNIIFISTNTAQYKYKYIYIYINNIYIINTVTCLDTFVSSSESSKVELRFSYVVSILFLIKSISSCYYFGLLALCVVFVDSDVDVFRR